jgi:farnesyl diphosphate synthase
MSDIQTFFSESQQQVERVLESSLKKNQVVSNNLSEAMQYAVLNGGKRFRPALCYASALALKAETQQVDCLAAAIELIHCYSLVHDDLPSMDDDDLRRGLPTCHIAFDEATAILAGDALQAFAFQVLAEVNPEIDGNLKLKMLIALSIASGSEGVAAGQALDLSATNKPCSLDELETIHRYKTGKIIQACIDLSAQALGAENSKKHLALQKYAKALGLAFQVKDDILDIEGCTEKLGKTSGADQALNKNTYPSLLGLQGAKDKAEELHEQAISALSEFGTEADTLRALSHYVIHREN